MSEPWPRAGESDTKSASTKSVLIAVRVHPFPSRTRQLSSLAPKILGWRRPGKIGSADTKRRAVKGLSAFFDFPRSVSPPLLPVFLLPEGEFPLQFRLPAFL